MWVRRSFHPSISRCARLSWLPSISSSTSISSLSFLWAVLRDVAHFAASKTHSLPHCFFSFFDRKSIYIHHIWVFHSVLNLLIVWAEKLLPCIGCILFTIFVCVAKNGHLSLIVIVQLDCFVLPSLNSH